MNVIFYNKDFSQTAQPSKELKISVERYSWNMTGGPRTAYLKAKSNADKWEMMKLLRAPIEIFGDDGKIVWWGFANRVTVPIGDKQRLGLGLNELFNYVIVRYSEDDTGAGSDTNSISEYGQKERLIIDTNLTSTNAEAKRDLYLLDHKYAKPEIDFSGGSDDIIIECYGWNSTLGWKHYSDTTTTDTAHETQIASIVSDAGQFLNGSIITDVSGLTSTALRDGSKTAGAYIDELLAAGTDNTQPYLSYVDENRYLHVFERTAQPSQPEYLLREDGKLITLLGEVIQDQECKVGIWVKPKGVPDMLGGLSAMRSFFVEGAEYNVARDKTVYRAAGAYDQITLASYIAAVSTGDSGGNVGNTIPGGNIYNVINPVRLNSALELVRTGAPATLAAVGDDMEWVSAPYSRGDAIFWPYDGNDEEIRLLKVGYYIFSWNIELTLIFTAVSQMRLWGADPRFVQNYPYAPVDAGTDTSVFGQSYLSYIYSVRTIQMQCLIGTAGMKWRGQLQIGYLGS